MRVILYIFVTLIQCGCSERQVNTMPLAEAYSDGFEVVVKNADGLFTSQRLKEAEQLVYNGATFNLDSGDVKQIEKDIDTENQKQTDQKYPFSNVSINANDNGEQTIELSHHFSKSTFSYTYNVINNKLTPVSSGYKDFDRNSFVVYK